MALTPGRPSSSRIPQYPPATACWPDPAWQGFTNLQAFLVGAQGHRGHLPGEEQPPAVDETTPEAKGTAAEEGNAVSDPTADRE